MDFNKLEEDYQKFVAETETQARKTVDQIRQTEGDARLEFNKSVNEFNQVNTDLDKSVDPVASQIVSSKYTTLAVIGFFICSVVIGAYLHKYLFC